MLVTVSQDRIGSVIVQPVSDRLRRRYAAHMKQWTGHADSSAYLQGDSGLMFLEESLSPSQRRDVEAGWTVRCRMDPWNFGHLLGWDAHTVAVR